MKKTTWFLLIALAIHANTIAASSLQPANLTCEYRVNPLGIDEQHPRFSWTFLLSGRNQRQTGYEIIVSDNPASIAQQKGNVWTTGKVTSSAQAQIAYEGPGLKSFAKYFWSVRTYDQDGQVSNWSVSASFETAMLNAADWQGKWIDDGRKQFEHDEEFYQDDRMPLFRKEISVKKKITSARLYIAGMGYYEAFINGKKISDHVLDPGWTTYKKEVLYVVHDITSSVKQGINVAGIMLGNGWWNPLPLRMFSRFNLRDFQQTGRPCVKAEIHLQFSDGSVEVIPTDQSWMTAPGPVVRNNVYLGEHYDARLEQRNWNLPNAEKMKWKNAVLTAGPTGKLQAQMQPPIRVTKVVKPVKITSIKPGVFIADLGQNFAGVVRIKVKGKAGTLVNLRYGEALLPDGTLNYFTTVAGQIKEAWHVNGGPGSPATAWQEDRYTLKGTGLETWAPRFTFHGFRFVEITGWPGTPTVNDLEGLRMNSDIQPVGEFACSNEMFNQIHNATQWTFLSNVFSVQSDCPGREKMGYGADLVVTADAYLYNYDMSTFYTKAVQDYANEQQPDGGITEIAPYYGIHDKGVGGESGPLGWELAFTYLQKQLYEFYGDSRIISAHYPAVVKQIEFLKSKSIDGLFHWDISDHEALDPKPEAFSASAFYYHHVILASEFAGILDKAEDSVKFKKLADQIKENIVSKYLIPNSGRFDNGTQSAQLFALWYGLTPERDKSMKALMNEFERHNWHVSSGIFGVKMMFDVLRTANRPEVAYTIANQKDFPGWGFMLGQGATTLWETWAYPDNAPSQNHPMFGSIDEWFYRSLLGINPMTPGFKKIEIKPQPAGDLTSAKGSYTSIHGKIVSDWKIEPGKFRLSVVIPSNTTATVWIPADQNFKITEGGKDISSSVKYVSGYAIIETGSGAYAFESTAR